MSLLLLLLLLTAQAADALVEDRSRAIVKFRYHGKPRVKCSNCRVGGTNYAPQLLADGVACVLEADGASWDCELPEEVRRFRVATNHSELVVLVERAALADDLGADYGSWSFGLKYVFWGIVLTFWRFLLQFIRGPVGGQLTAWWIRERGEEKEKRKRS